MQTALISTPTRTYAPSFTMPLGIMYLASYLEQNGHTVELMDVAKTRQSNQATIKQLNKFKPDLIGISGIVTAYGFAKTLIRDLKKAFPKTPLVIGGLIVLDNYEKFLCNAGCDYAVKGYGEKSLLFLIEHLEGKRAIEDIPNLVYFKNGRVLHNPGYVFFDKADDIPLPAYSKIDMEYYLTIFKKEPKLDQYLVKTQKPRPPMRCAYVMIARGCPAKCSYCVYEFEHKGFYTHSIEYVIKHIQLLYEKYNTRIFRLGGDVSLCNAEQARELTNAMNSNFPEAYFTLETKSNFVTQEMVDVLQDSNCIYLIYGFESGSDAMLKILNKGTTRKTNIDAYKVISKTKIFPGVSFMVGTPGETKQSLAENIRAIEEADIRYDTAVFYTTPYPGSRLYKWCVEQNFIKDEEAYLNLISDRDAMQLTINLTPYPNIVLRMMRTMILNAIEKNKQKHGFRISPIRLLIKHKLIPMLYEFYFFTRKILSVFFAKYKRDTINLVLNKRSTLKLSTDRE